MSDHLENLVKQAETSISTPRPHGRARPPLGRMPKMSLAAIVWLSFILLAIFQFETIVAVVAGPAESKIESDLGAILKTAGASLESYRARNGALPPILPNPAIRGLVRYERQSNYAYQLSATIQDVVMLKTSERAEPFRERVVSQ